MILTKDWRNLKSLEKGQLLQLQESRTKCFKRNCFSKRVRNLRWKSIINGEMCSLGDQSKGEFCDWLNLTLHQGIVIYKKKEIRHDRSFAFMARLDNEITLKDYCNSELWTKEIKSLIKESRYFWSFLVRQSSTSPNRIDISFNMYKIIYK